MKPLRIPVLAELVLAHVVWFANCVSNAVASPAMPSPLQAPVQDKTPQEALSSVQQEPERQRLFEDPYDFSVEPKLPEIVAPTAEELRSAINRGIEFLIESQNPDGSWGSHDASRPFQIYAPIPGAHDAFRSAVTALCISSLIESGADEDAKIQEAIDRGTEWLSKNIPDVKRATGVAMYNVWSHAYAVQAYVRLYRRAEGDAEKQKEFADLIRLQFERLNRYESVDGGWGYYDFRNQARKPTSSSTSFVNAAVLVAYKEAHDIGVAPDEKTVQRAVESTRRQQKADFTYLYGEYLKDSPMAGINRPAGSLGRSQACNVAMRRWGDTTVTDLVLKNWLYRLYVRNGWLSIGRKRPIPHEAWFQVAGYFYYFGHYYAALCVDELPASERPPYQHHLAKIIMAYQETDGSWWDYPMYGYHKPYGTAFALMTLYRCQHSEATTDTESSHQGSSKPSSTNPSK